MADVLDDPSRAAAVAVALERVEPGMTLGLGSGRAVLGLVEAVAARWPGRPPLRAVAASSATETIARAAGLEVLGLDDDVTLDRAFDGDDEVLLGHPDGSVEGLERPRGGPT